MRSRVLTILLFLPIAVFSQRIMTGVSTGYFRSFPSLENYTSAGHIPVTVTFAAGFRPVQFGLQYTFNAVAPTYLYPSRFGYPDRFREIYQEQFLLGIVRFNDAPDPAVDWGITGRLGAGILYGRKEIRLDDGENTLFRRVTYDNGLVLFASFGFLLPLFQQVHIDIEGNFYYTSRKSPEGNTGDVGFTTLGVGPSVGITYSFY